MSNRRRRRSGSGKSIQTKKRQQQQRMAIMIGGTIAAIVIALFLYDRYRPVDAPLTDDYDTKYAELERGTSPEGYPQLGNANAPIEIREFSSFTCPACNSFHQGILDNLIDTHLRTGQVKVVFVPVDSIPAGTPAPVTARAGYCALDQGMFWEMHDIMFHWQELVAPNERRLNVAAEEMGMDADKFADCMNDGDTGDRIDDGMAEFDQRSLSSTPSVFLNGEYLPDWSGLVGQIDSMVAN